MRFCLLALALLTGLPAAVAAQLSPDSLSVPEAALRVLQIPVDANRPLAMLRAIRLLHSVAKRDESSQPGTEFARLLDALDRVERELARTSGRGIATAMASANSADRDALRDTLDALGLRLREQRGVYSVEPKIGKDETELRALLTKAGIDTAAIQTRLNVGETVNVTLATIALPLPLPFESWPPDVVDSRIGPARLFSAIIRNRDASLLFYGVQTMTADTRAYLVKTPDLVPWLLAHAPVVAAFGAAFRVGSDGRAMVPGGAEAEELWESLVDEKLNRPDRFARALFSRDGGRLAYFADSLSALDEAHARFALGLGISDRRVRIERFAALYQVFTQIDPSWSVSDRPFNRPSHDVPLLLANLHLTEAGLLAAPAYRRLWERAVGGIDLPDPGDRQMGEPAEDGVADAAFLAGFLAGKYSRDRRLIIERIDAGQRIFGEATDAEMPDVLVALRAYGRFPAAILALERIGIRKPAIYAQAARRIASIETINAPEAIPLLTQFEGSLALLERLGRTAAMPASTLERLATSLIAVTVDDDRYQGRVADWLQTQLIPELPSTPGSPTAEERLLDALVDRYTTGGKFSWEGEDFVVTAERPRRDLKAVREKQKGNSVDSLLAVYGHVSALSGPGLTVDTLKTRAAMLRTDAGKLLPARPWPDAPDAAPVVVKIVDRVIKEVTGIRNEKDVGKAARIVRPLVDALDYMLGETLVALAYASSMSDTGRGPAAAVDISHRHLFGFTTAVGDDRRLVAWRRPIRGSGGVGDAVTGALMGLDLALSKTRLKRLSLEALPEAPKLNTNDVETLTNTVALLNPRELDDARGRQIADAVQRGRTRVDEAANDARALDGLAAEARIDVSRRSVLDWTVHHASSFVPDLFSIGELFRLGGGRPSTVRAWGTAQGALTGCLCIRFPDDAAWELTIGRTDTGQMGARLMELNLRVTVLLADLRVPATLFPAVMALATQDFIDSVPLVYADDWAAIARRASTLSRERVEDYVSAVIASGPVRAVEEAGAR